MNESFLANDEYYMENWARMKSKTSYDEQQKK